MEGGACGVQALHSGSPVAATGPGHCRWLTQGTSQAAPAPRVLPHSTAPFLPPPP